MSERESEPQAVQPGLDRVEEPTGYGTALDYLRVLYRHKVLIAVITLAFAAAAFLYSSARTETYEARAELSFQDMFAGVELVGVAPGSFQLPPTERAAAHAALVTRPEVERQARRRLDADLSLGELGGSVSARVGTEANIVIVDGRAADGQVAAQIANAYAQAAKSVAEEEELGRAREARRAVLREIERLGEDDLAAQSETRLPALEQLHARLEAIEQVGEPVQVVRRAEAPDAPTSPRTTYNTALGGLVGLIVGLLAAFGRASLDRRVHGAEQVHDELGAPVLARVSDSALGYAGLASNGLPPMVEGDFEAFRSLRVNLGALRADPAPRSILVTSPLPEEGKSTVSMALASAAAIAGQRVLLVEGDLRRPIFEERLGVSRAPGLTDYLLGRAAPQEILKTVELSFPTAVNGAAEPEPTQRAGALVCIAAGTQVPNPAELLVTERFRSFLQKVSKAYDLVVIDSSPLLVAVDALELLPEVDAAVVCVRVEQTTVDQVRAARAALSNLPERPTGVVLTGMRRRGPGSYGYYGSYGHYGY